ncbi:hypothetical protein MHYP_G00178970 [Metynnis hypsauchen]
MSTDPSQRSTLWRSEVGGKSRPGVSDQSRLKRRIWRITESQLYTRLSSRAVQDDPLLIYGLAVGCRIKQQLWEKLFCSTLIDYPKVDSHYQITKSYSGAGLQRTAPQSDVDISGEPSPQQSKRKTRH